MKSSAYWQRRFEELEAALLQKGERYNADEVERQFHLTMAEIEKEIARWYQRLGDNNEISAADARKLLSRDELKEFHWTVEEYIKRGRESNYTDKWKKQLENASAKVHITRFEAMKLQLQQQLEVLYGNQVDGLDKLMKDIYTEGFRRSAFTIDTGMGVHYDLSAVNPQRIDTIVKNPWVADGKNFSDRLWRDKDKLVSTLQQEMQNAVARGDKLDTAVKNIAKRMNAAKSAAARLVMTESAFISGKAQRDCFADLDVEEYEFVATLDRKTSETCRAHDGKVYKVKDYKPGTNAPPMHCWCRSCIVPYFGDDEKSELTKTDIQFKNMDGANWDKTKLLLGKLSSEYKTKLKTVKHKADRKTIQSGSGEVDITSSSMRLSSTLDDVVVHEFAHTLAVEKADKFGLTDNHLFWNEIRKIRTAYRKARAKDPNISISAYTDNPDKNYLDEFMAEAFAHAKCAEMGLPTLGFGKDYTYSKQVLEVIDKYFKLPKTEIGRQSVAFKSMDKRAARDPDTGKRVMVPADMTYSEWEKKFSNRTSSQNRLINDIIPRGSNRGVSKVSDVHYVGKLDKSLYECVTKDIRTDDVIITDERIQHIKDHHPKDYERFMQYFPLIVAAPDYIFEANLPNTAFLLKTFRTKNENFNIILRLATSDDPDNYSNSIITFMKISDKKARKYIRNKKKLYTRPNNSYNESS
ncbi:MAG: minor capsid protein [Selenomonadaceae bacterium]|nr:minor capsid protein [Selenomonadaceae bacterium]